MKFFDIAFPWFMGLFVAVFAVLTGLVIYNAATSVCVRTEVIQRVNGCDWRGTCGWVTENHQGVGSSPVEGQRVCVERKEPFPWLR